MAEQKQYKAGDTFVLPVSFQLLKVLGHEDRVYYLCAPVDDVKQAMCLKNPFFLMCLEAEDDKPSIPAEVLERAYNFVNLESDADEEAGE